MIRYSFPAVALVFLAIITFAILVGVTVAPPAAGLAAATPSPVLFVSILNADGSLPIRGGNVQLWRDDALVEDRPNDSGYLQFDMRVAGRYCVRPVPPVGYRSLEQVLCQEGGAYLVFYYVSLPPSPTPTALVTPWPTETPAPYGSTPTVDPFVLPPELHIELYALDGRLLGKGVIILEATPLPRGSGLP